MQQKTDLATKEKHYIETSDMITKLEACVLADISQPTLDRYIKKGVFKEYALGRKRKYLLKSELTAAMKDMKQQ